MTQKSGMSRYSAILLVVLAVTALSLPAHAADDAEEASQDLSAGAISQEATAGAIADTQEMGANTKQAIILDLKTNIETNSENKLKALNALEKMEYRRDSYGMPNYSAAAAISNERVRSVVLSEEARKMLDEINYKVMNGYRRIPSVGLYGTENPNLAGSISAMGALFRLQTHLFCDPDQDMANKPPECGAAPGLSRNEHLIDFFLSERTWPTTTVLDAMQLARGYFFGVDTGTTSIEAMASSSATFMAEQRRAAKDSLRMSILNFLGSRRSPSSTATGDVLKVMLQGMAVTGSITSVNYETICNKKSQTNQLEMYACNMTNTPEKPGEARIISQAAIDRIMQHDYYLSPMYYAAINSPTNSSRASQERMEVMMIAQQLTQEYYFLRMLQMKTASAALSIVD